MKKRAAFFLAGFLLSILLLYQRDADTMPQILAAIPSATPTDKATPTLEPPPTSESPTQTSTPALTPFPTLTSVPTQTPDIFTGVNRFNYGAQVNWTNVDNNQEMIWLTGMGFKWAKAQVRWCDFERTKGNIDFAQMDQLIRSAKSKGITVLFSIVCAPNWSRVVNRNTRNQSGPPDNFQEGADFIGKIAARYCDGTLGAIEVWNEHNLLKEWDDQRGISAALYMDLLKRAHAVIKSKCPSILVVSGAPTPTGVQSAEAVDDLIFLRQMYANGLKDFSDAIGAHPAGFCNAPDASEGVPNVCGGQYNNHRSFFFRRTLEEYRKVMIANDDAGKQIWPTEFGWGVDPSPKPGYEYEKNINADTQARWLAQGYKMMKEMKYIGVAMVWNLDFTDMNNETGAFHILGRPAQSVLTGMPK